MTRTNKKKTNREITPTDVMQAGARRVICACEQITDIYFDCSCCFYYNNNTKLIIIVIIIIMLISNESNYFNLFNLQVNFMSLQRDTAIK